MASSSMMSSAEAPAASGPGKIPAAALIGDIAIAAPGSKDEGYGYIGVWATDAATCATIGNPPAAGYVVIARTEYRDSNGAQFSPHAPLSGGKVSLQVGSKTVALEQTSPDALSIDGVAMVRCTP